VKLGLEEMDSFKPHPQLFLFFLGRVNLHETLCLENVVIKSKSDRVVKHQQEQQR
jgi:hypothetical protein